MSLHQFYIRGYRITSFTFLTAAMVTLAVYGITMIFFLFDSTWIAPTVLSTTSDKMLQFEGGYLTVTAQQGTANVAYNQAVRQVEVLTQQKDQLAILLAKSDSAIKVETTSNKVVIDQASLVANQRKKDLNSSALLSSQLETIKSETQNLLAAHVITQDIATQNLATIQSFGNSLTDSKTALLLLNQQTDDLSRKRETLLGAGKSVDAMISITAYASIQQLARQNLSDLKTAQDTVTAAKAQLDLATAAVSTLNQTSYMAARKSGSNLAFVPYDNQRIAKVGSSVYDCYLLFVACHKIGTIRHVYHDELIVDFPLFNIKLSRTIRGFLIDLDVTNEKAMSSSVLFVNKPLFL